MSPRYGDPQVAIGVVFAVLALLLATAFAVIAKQAGSEVAVERVHGSVTGCGTAGSPCSSSSAWSSSVCRSSSCPTRRGGANGRTLVM